MVVLPLLGLPERVSQVALPNFLILNEFNISITFIGANPGDLLLLRPVLYGPVRGLLISKLDESEFQGFLLDFELLDGSVEDGSELAEFFKENLLRDIKLKIADIDLVVAAEILSLTLQQILPRFLALGPSDVDRLPTI